MLHDSIFDGHQRILVINWYLLLFIAIDGSFDGVRPSRDPKISNNFGIYKLRNLLFEHNDSKVIFNVLHCNFFAIKLIKLFFCKFILDILIGFADIVSLDFVFLGLQFAMETMNEGDWLEPLEVSCLGPPFEKRVGCGQG